MDFDNLNCASGMRSLSIEPLEVSIDGISDIAETILDVVKTDEAGVESDNGCVFILSDKDLLDVIVGKFLFVAKSGGCWVVVDVHGTFCLNLLAASKTMSGNQVGILTDELEDSNKTL